MSISLTGQIYRVCSDISRRLRRRSIFLHLTTRLMMTMSFFFLCIGFFICYGLIQMKQNQVMESSVNVLTSLTQSLIKPLNDRDMTSVTAISDVFLQNDLIVQLRIENPDRKTIYWQTKSLPDFHLRKTAAVRNDEWILGYITIDFSTDFTRDYIRFFLLIYGGTVLTMIFVLIVQTKMILRNKFTKHLNYLGELSALFGGDTSHVPENWEPCDEFRPFFEILEDVESQMKYRIDELKRSEEQYRSFFENAVEGIFRFGIDGKILHANRALANMMGYASPDDLMFSVSDISRQLFIDPNEYRTYIDILKMGGRIIGAETLMKRKTGKIIWVAAFIRLVLGEKGDIDYIEGSLINITEQKRSMSKLRKQHDRLEEMVEMRTLDLLAVQDTLRDVIEERKRSEAETKKVTPRSVQKHGDLSSH